MSACINCRGEAPCRLVGMRIHKDQRGERQLKLLASEDYVYRVFATNEPGYPHQIIDEYDQHDDVENLIGEAQPGGALATCGGCSFELALGSRRER